GPGMPSRSPMMMTFLPAKMLMSLSSFALDFYYRRSGNKRMKTVRRSDVLLDHGLHVLDGGVLLDAGGDHLTVLVDGDDGQTQDLLADGQAAGLGGIQGAELDLVAVGLGAGVDVGHQGGAGHASVAVEIHKNLAGSLQDFRFKSILIQFQHGDRLLFFVSYYAA